MIITANSTLVSLFTSLANKIRSKLGTSGKYTPAEAISAIDDVYTKGVTDTKKGDAAVDDVKSGKTFTSTNGVELTGTFAQQTLSAITPSTSSQTETADSGKYFTSVTVNAISPQRSTGTAASGSGRDSTGPYVYIPYGWWPNANSSRNYTRLTEAQAIAVARTQTKTTDATRTTHTVSPDSNYLLSSVTVNKFPDATGTFTPSSSQYNTSVADMTVTNNYRYVNTKVCYDAGYAKCKRDVAIKEITLMAPAQGSWCLPLFPFTCSKITFNQKVYQAGSYVSGDYVYIRNTSGTTLKTYNISDISSGTSFSGTNLYSMQVVLASSSIYRQVYLQFTCS